MRNEQQIGRRTWLARIALGGFAVWSELNFGFGRKGWSVAIGDRKLAVGMAHAQTLEQTQVLRVRMDRVNGYVVIRGKEVGIVDTGTAGNEVRFADVIRKAGMSWNAVQSYYARGVPSPAHQR